MDPASPEKMPSLERPPGMRGMSLTGRTTLHAAAQDSVAAVDLVLAESPALDVDSRDGTGCTPLMLAARFNHTGEIVERLAAAGADPAAVSNDGVTALHYAAQNGHEAVVAQLSRSLIQNVSWR
eukprot:TRINITY_DN11969_c0_g1_i2.p1 TRINITY_DN11969_c0_g1~~TRINITY_DN11969_c0_g1_i2.p1  ORF type:complete len:124 (-),score=17.85 TRINITY_DN11969_c0_g1_i2:54-425(-)